MEAKQGKRPLVPFVARFLEQPKTANMSAPSQSLVSTTSQTHGTKSSYWPTGMDANGMPRSDVENDSYWTSDPENHWVFD